MSYINTWNFLSPSDVKTLIMVVTVSRTQHLVPSRVIAGQLVLSHRRWIIHLSVLPSRLWRFHLVPIMLHDIHFRLLLLFSDMVLDSDLGWIQVGKRITYTVWQILRRRWETHTHLMKGIRSGFFLDGCLLDKQLHFICDLVRSVEA